MGNGKHWFWSEVGRLKPLYIRAGFAALLTNIFAFVISIYSMAIYDRVIPSESVDSLSVLLSGVLLLLILDYLIRAVRSALLDLAGRQIDQVVASEVFENIILRARGESRQDGAVAAAIREFDTIKEFISAATITTFVDLPFSILFLLALFYLASYVAFIPLTAIGLLLLMGYMGHRKMTAMSKATQKESQNKQATIIESLQNRDLISAMDAGGLFFQRWKQSVMAQAEAQHAHRDVSNQAMNRVQFLTQTSQILVLSFGAYLAFQKQLGTGALVASSILASRALAPYSQVVSLLSRLSQVVQSYKVLDSMIHEKKAAQPVVQSPVDIHGLRPILQIQNVVFQYPASPQPILNRINLQIAPPYKIAILGKSGAGKTTLLKIFAGLQSPTHGDILFDGLNLNSFAHNDRNQRMSFAFQDAMLFSGTLLQNITLGVEPVNTERMMRLIDVCVLTDFIKGLPDGLNTRVLERGGGFSGGQRQLISLCRALYRDADFYFFDEPTSSLDPNTESLLLKNLTDFLKDKAVLFSTHKPKPLELSTHCLVIDQGKVSMFDQTDEVMRKLNDAARKAA